MITVKLNKLIFFSFHGVHEEERILGNNFEVQVELSFETAEKIVELKQTVDYVAVYEIIKLRMSIPSKLLETIVQDIAHQIQLFDKQVKSISVSIEKINPPIKNMQGSVGVNYKQDF